MSFLKNHYEKLILTFLLALFVIMFGVHVLSVTFETASVSPADELLSQSILDHYTPLNLDSDDLDPKKIMEKSISRWDSVPDNKKKKDRKEDKAKAEGVEKEGKEDKSKADGRENVKEDSMDLLVPYPLARCPHGKHLISINNFDTKEVKCSYCLRSLPALASGNDALQVRYVDSDNDGIPDEIEIRYGLNPRDAKDAGEDLDKDGYSNLEEHKAQTDLRSPASHPPYGNKLYVVKVMQKSLGFTLNSFKSAKKGKDKKTWSARFTYYQKDKRGALRPKGINVKYNSSFELKFTSDKKGRVTYILKDIQEKWDENGVNRSLAVVTTEKDKTPIIIGIGKQAIDPHQVVSFIFDVSFDKKREKTCEVGKKITLGNDTVGKDSYLLVSADAEKKTAMLKATRSEQIIIAREWTGGSGEQQNDGMEGQRPEEPVERPVRRRPARQRRGGGLPSFD